MKKIIAFAAFAMMGLIAGNVSAQTKKECSVYVKSERNSKSRGINIFQIDPAKIIAIPESIAASRGAGQCYLVVENSCSEDVNVFIDSSYVGFVPANKKGYIVQPKGYSIVHAWTVSGKHKWVERGDCKDCKMTFILNKPEEKN